MTMRVALRLLLLAVMLLAPMGRIGVAEAMAGHCADVPAAAPAHHQSGRQEPPAPRDDKGQAAIDCMVACAAMAPAPAPAVVPQARAVAIAAGSLPASLTGLRPEAATPPPRTA